MRGGGCMPVGLRCHMCVLCLCMCAGAVWVLRWGLQPGTTRKSLLHPQGAPSKGPSGFGGQVTLGMLPAPPTCPLAAFPFLFSFFPLFHSCRQQHPQLWQQGQGWGWQERGLGSSLPAHPPALLLVPCGCLCRLGEDPAQIFPPA